MSENNDYIQLPPLKKDTPSDVVAFMWEYIKVPEDSREKVKNLLKDANENGVKNEKGVYITPAFPKLIYVLEDDNITEAEREEFLDRFSEESDRTLVAFGIMGGIFGEGIDPGGVF